MDINKIYNEKRPVFGRRHGCTWDHAWILTAKGKERGYKLKGYYDSTWGRWIHFNYGGQWKKISLQHPAVNGETYKIDLSAYL